MIKVKDLSKNYGTVEAVKSISFDLNDGEVIGRNSSLAASVSAVNVINDELVIVSFVMSGLNE